MALVLPLIPISASAGGADWPQVGFDGGRSAHNRQERALRTANVDQLRQDWSRRVRPNTSFIYEYHSDVAVVRDGRVFACWAGSEAFHVLVAFDERSGERLWSIRSDAWREPIAASGSTLVTSARDSIRAFDVVTGEPRWRRASSFPFAADRPVRHVIAFERDGPERRVSSIVVATGDRAWSRRLQPRGGRYASVVVSQGRVILGVVTERGPRLVALRLKDGSTDWSTRGRAVPVAAADGRVFLRRWIGGRLAVLDVVGIHEGRRVWKRRTAAWPMAVGGGRVFLGRTECIWSCEGDSPTKYRGVVLALDAGTGNLLWQIHGNDAVGRPVWMPGALARGLLFVQRFAFQARPVIGALSAATGRMRWVARVGGPSNQASVDAVANGSVFVGLRFGDRGGRIVRFCLPTRRSAS
jgi:outer membrane protein assembly factor BamB